MRNARISAIRIIFVDLYFMQIQIKRIDQTLPLPRYETKGAVAFDMLARTPITVVPKSIALIPANIIVLTPPGFMLLIASRSSLPIKKGLIVSNGIGVIDQDFCGPEDEIKIQVYNIGDAPVQIERGERIAQGIFVKIEQAEWRETNEISEKSRGGFGSTGGYTKKPQT